MQTFSSVGLIANSLRCHLAPNSGSRVRGRIIEIAADSEEEVLHRIPPDIHAPVREVVRVVLLRATREVMEALRTHGWHTGYWRDPVTGQDNGIRNLFASTQSRAARSAGLWKIARLLHDEAHQIPGGVPTLWHEEITPDLFKGGDFQVFEIAALHAGEAIEKLTKLTHEQSIAN